MPAITELTARSETNLKLKRAKVDTNGLKSAEHLSGLLGVVRCDAPNNNLHKFNGAIELVDSPKIAVTNDNVLLRGCILRNTETCFAVAVYTGADTKVMLNGGVVRFKRTQIDVKMNKLVWLVRLSPPHALRDDVIGRFSEF